MLAPDARLTLFDALRPPPGYSLGMAVGTTFSLNLDAALTAPAAFALHAAAVAQEERGVEPLELLDSLRRHADRFTIFFQAGQVTVPVQRRLFAYLEGALIPVTAPLGGVFHPKVWVLRFDAPEAAPAYRLLCASRNLTFDRSWDTMLRLDSADDSESSRALLESGELASLVAALPDLVVGKLDDERRSALTSLSAELQAVRWAAPDGFSGGTFRALGLQHSNNGSPFPRRADRLAVISPFLSGSLIDELPRARGRRTLISRPEEMAACAKKVHEVFDETLTLDPDASLAVEAAAESASREDPGVPFEGLHAKLYVFDVGTTSTVFTGSANATRAGFGSNVEFLTELVGPRSELGVEKLLAEPTKDVQTLRSFLVPFDVPDVDAPAALDSTSDELDSLRRSIAAVPLRARAASAGDDNHFTLSFSWQSSLPQLPEGATWRCWPITGSEGAAKPVSAAAQDIEFAVSFEGITAFLASEIVLGEVMTRFVLRADLEEAPANRSSRLLRMLLGDAERFLRYLLLLLADETADLPGLSEILEGLDDPDGGRWQVLMDAIPLLEALLRTLARDPDRLEHVQRLLADLQAEPEGQAIVPQSLMAIWAPVWAVAEELRR